MPIPGARPRTIRLTEGARDRAMMTVSGPALGPRAMQHLLARTRYVLRIDDNLTPFYSLASRDPTLKWVQVGAGRMMRSPTVFEDVVKTICTTNCTWSATVRMVTALVAYLGERAPTAPATGWYGRAFPTPEAMATAGERFYLDVVRAGYRGPYLLALACATADGSLNLESFVWGAPCAPSDEQVAAQLLALPGVGPYAAAHIMMLLGRYSRLILDSWTRPTYWRLVGKRSGADATIRRRFRPYGRYAGLAFWLYLTKDWIEDDRSSDFRSPRGAGSG